MEKMDATVVKERWEKWGGIPRFVFSKDQLGLEADLRKALAGMDLSLIDKYLRTPEISEGDQKTVSHKVFQYRIVDDSFRECELDFASPQIARAVIDGKAEADYRALIGHYEQMRRSEWQGAYVGHLWEHLCHKILPAGIQEGYQLEPLSDVRSKTRRIIKEGIAVGIGSMVDMSALLQAGEYFQPAAPNFPVVDAALMEGNFVYGFQMTVASSHPPKAREAAELLESMPGGKEFHLVWVVDGAKKDHIKTPQSFVQSKIAAEKLDDTAMKKLQQVPQWLLKLHFPKENPFRDI